MRLQKHVLALAILSLLGGVAQASPWPTATPDYVSTTPDQSTTISVLDNDIGTELALTTVNTTTVEGGSASISEDKLSVIYQPAAGFKGVDYFWYNFTDNEGRKNAAKVAIYVTDPEPPVGEKPEAWPGAAADLATTTDQNLITIPVLENDTGMGLTLTSVNEWSSNGGKVFINPDNKTLSYRKLGLPAVWPETDSFWYVMTDAWGRTNSAKVTIALGESAAQDWTTAREDNSRILKNTQISIDVLSNDFGTGKFIKSVNESSVKWGTISIDGNKAVYTPPADFTGQDEFWYVVENIYGKTDSAKVLITVEEPGQTVQLGQLNDTGAVTCADFPVVGHDNADLTTCSGVDAEGDPIPPKQDATNGRDVTHADDSDGHAGFSFTKLDADGQPLAAEATTWSCVKDNVTGLIWESKVGLSEGIRAAGLHGADDQYTWYDSNTSTNGGDAGTRQHASLISCHGYQSWLPETWCNTEAFAQRVNTEALCGITTWRLPSLPELQSIANYDGRAPTIDTAYFPNTAYATYHTSSTNVAYPSLQKAFAFYDGHMLTHPKNRNTAARLVSNAPVAE
ncbi:Ig-like domain-containing protein [Leucothrix mucor]|uniref:Ig-like domain-containing protein n=1 Tax=Leucothrix mucor TaxID=45248 RepID=UPI0003B36C6E|nr:DUF1566 domain-containing protein [Leucothrix mucor]